MRVSRSDWRELGALELANRLYEIGVMASQTGDLDGVVRSVVKRILTELDADYVGISLADEARRVVSHKYGLTRDGSVVPEGKVLAYGEGVNGQVVATGQPICLDDVGTYSNYVALVPGIASELCVPMKLGGTVIGALDVESTQPGQFGETEVAVLQVLATPVAQAIQNAWIFREERRRREQLQLLNKVGTTVTSTVDLDELLQRTAETIRLQAGYPLVGIALEDEDTGRLVLRALSTEVRVSMEVGYSQAHGEGVVGEVFRTGRSMLIPDVKSWPRYIAAGREIRSEMCCAIKAGKKVIGILDVESHVPYAFGEADLLVLQTIADHISQAVANAQSIRRSQQMREDLARMIIHDMRNPLTVVHSTLEYVGIQIDKESESLARNAGHYIQSGLSACEQMTVMLDSLLELQKIEAGEVTLHKLPLDMRRLVSTVAGKLQIVARMENVSLTTAISGDCPTAELDIGLMTRVIENLVVNALKFTPEAGKVRLLAGPAPPGMLETRLDGRKEGLLIRVEDTGPGIPEKEKERIFEKFSMLETHYEGKRRGTGLGLAFCKQAVMAHGGAIWVESRADGGSTFHVLLPLA
jgi:signal transduction histidine kinase